MSSSSRSRTIAITGAGGFLGRALLTYLLQHQYQVNALVHSSRSIANDDPRIKWIVGDICNEDTLSRLLVGVDVVVHLAARKSDEHDSERVNVLGARKLVAACKQVGVRGIINISTISTKLRRAGIYGNTKRAGDAIIRNSSIPSRTLLLSIIYDHSGEGVFGTIMRYARLPIVPVIGSGTVTFCPIHVADVAEAIERIIRSPIVGERTYTLGGPDRVSFNTLVSMIGRQLYGKSPWLVHTPVWLGVVIARCLGLLFQRPPVTMSNILGMMEDLEVDSSDFVRDYQFQPRPLATGIASCALHSAQQDKNIDYGTLEAKVFLEYVSGYPPMDSTICSYQVAVNNFGLAEHRISPLLLNSPLLFGAFDAVTKFTRRRGIFQRKMLIAAALYECTPASSEVLLPREHTIGALICSVALCAIRSVGKLLLGVLLLCIPGFYKRNA